MFIFLGLTIAAAPACKKDEESAPPVETADEVDSGDDSSSDADEDDSEAPEEQLSQTLFEETVQGNMGDVLDCYTQAAAENPELAGKVLVAFTIAADGSVESAAIDESSTLSDETMNSCLDGKFRAWSFARPPSGESMTLTFPFTLAPA